MIKYNTLRKLAAPLVLAAGLVGLTVGCNFPETRQTESKILHEDATVSDAVYIPPMHGEGDGIGPTFSNEGDIGIALSSISVSIPEEYAVVFKCAHGGFISKGGDERHKALYLRLAGEKGKKVDVAYTELYREKWRDINNDGKNELKERTLKGYNFLDAKVKTNNLGASTQ